MKTWVYEPSVDVWWTNIALARGQHRKAITLISWEVWKERNTRVFRHHQSTGSTVIAKITDEARSWGLTGAKYLSYVILGE
jgi:hypothetical protein